MHARAVTVSNKKILCPNVKITKNNEFNDTYKMGSPGA